jgi:hypothetical protein
MARRTSYGGGCLSQFFFLLAAYSVFQETLGNGNSGFVVTMTGTTVLLAIGLALKALESRIGERERTRQAKELYDSSIASAKTDRSVDAYLYLRPFAMTDKLHVAQSKIPLPILPSYFDVESEREYEQLLAEALEQIAPLIALGQPGEHEGAGRIALGESEWREAIKLLSRSCRAIFVLPSFHEGTVWEISYLRDSNLLKKTVFLMPGADFAKSFDLADHWNKSSEAIAERCGFWLPPYEEDGAWFRLAENGEVVAKVTDKVTASASRDMLQHEPAKPDNVIAQLGAILEPELAMRQTLVPPPMISTEVLISDARDPRGSLRLNYLALIGLMCAASLALSLCGGRW